MKIQFISSSVFSQLKIHKCFYLRLTKSSKIIKRSKSYQQDSSNLLITFTNCFLLVLVSQHKIGTCMCARINIYYWNKRFREDVDSNLVVGWSWVGLEELAKVCPRGVQVLREWFRTVEWDVSRNGELRRWSPFGLDRHWTRPWRRSTFDEPLRDPCPMSL
jgi:hypothetical protein